MNRIRVPCQLGWRYIERPWRDQEGYFTRLRDVQVARVSMLLFVLACVGIVTAAAKYAQSRIVGIEAQFPSEMPTITLSQLIARVLQVVIAILEGRL